MPTTSPSSVAGAVAATAFDKDEKFYLERVGRRQETLDFGG